MAPKLLDQFWAMLSEYICQLTDSIRLPEAQRDWRNRDTATNLTLALELARKMYGCYPDLQPWIDFLSDDASDLIYYLNSWSTNSILPILSDRNLKLLLREIIHCKIDNIDVRKISELSLSDNQQSKVRSDAIGWQNKVEQELLHRACSMTKTLELRSDHLTVDNLDLKLFQRLIAMAAYQINLSHQPGQLHGLFGRIDLVAEFV